MNYADDRTLRQEMYTAYNTRASGQDPNAGKWDNGPLMTQILSLRQELAHFTGLHKLCGILTGQKDG